MTAHDRQAAILKAIRGVPLWMWPVWAGGVVVLVGLVSLLFFTSDAGPRAVIVNDTAAPLRIFYCTKPACDRGDGTSDEVIEPGEVTTDFWPWPDVNGLVGLATVPGERLLGCLADTHPGQDMPHPYSILASSLRLCPGQTSAVQTIVSMDNQ